MRTVWITYAWADNKSGDVDYLAQELGAAGITVKLDRWNVGAGRRLWEQICEFITNPAGSDAWILYATQNSLSSEPCREEFAIALDRALSTRGESYPIISLFPAPADQNVLPASIRTRLFVSLTDPDWKERTVAAIEGRAPAIHKPQIDPFVIQVLSPAPPPYKYVLEVRPRAGVWNPFMFGVPSGEAERVGLTIRSGPARRIPSLGGLVFTGGEYLSGDGKWRLCLGHEAATPALSYYAFFREMPSALVFGEEGTPGRAWFVQDNLRVVENQTSSASDVAPLFRERRQ